VVYQGENDDVRHNDLVGEFTLEGLADVKAGNEVLIRFDLDLDGILKVTAREKATGLEKALTIDNTLSRFRTQDRDRAQARIDSVFGSPALAGPHAAPVTSGAERVAAAVSPQAALAIGRAQDLLVKCDELIEMAPPQDAAELTGLATELRAAIQSSSLDDVSRLTATLDDMLFYLKDV
jgi:molecular chaperone DnaK